MTARANPENSRQSSALPIELPEESVTRGAEQLRRTAPNRAELVRRQSNQAWDFELETRRVLEAGFGALTPSQLRELADRMEDGES